MPSPPHIDCPSCKNLAWHGNFQQPVVKAGKAHHPSCLEVAPRGIVTTRTGFYARRAVGGVVR
jgi:hypothetical protein